MKIFKILLLGFFLFGLLLPMNTGNAQDSNALKEEFSKFEEAIYDTLPVQIIVDNDAKVKVENTEKKAKKDKKEESVDINGFFFLNLAIDLVTVFLIIFFIYYPNNKRQEYVFTFILFNLIIFLLTYVLNEVKISMGAAFGLFAVFSMLRYRTAGISMKNMTYLFIFIAIGLLSAIHLKVYENIAINAIIVIFTFILDSKLIFKAYGTKRIDYDNTELIKPENKEKLIEDLRQRTGLDIYDVDISRVNFLKDSARVQIYYND
ncbi:MAG: DUF4956 domain-containing protein [Bacteroidales bacterium]|nr:DUF4956 domain-containing protein [Bacteroidales bacterium]